MQCNGKPLLAICLFVSHLQACRLAGQWLATDAIAVVETDAKETFDHDGWEVLDERERHDGRQEEGELDGVRDVVQHDEAVLAHGPRVVLVQGVRGDQGDEVGRWQQERRQRRLP